MSTPHPGPFADPSTCTHDNTTWREVASCAERGSEVTYDMWMACPDCGSRWTVDEFDALCLDAYNLAAAEALHYEHGYLELYGHLTTVK